MALALVYFKTAFMNRARKDEVVGRFCPPARARRAQAPAAPRAAPVGAAAGPNACRSHGGPGDAGTGPWFNAARDKGSLGTLQGVPGAALRLCAGIEPQRGARHARNRWRAQTTLSGAALGRRSLLHPSAFLSLGFPSRLSTRVPTGTGTAHRESQELRGGG